MNQQLRADVAAGVMARPAEPEQACRGFLTRCRRRARVIERGAGLIAEGDAAPGAVWVLSGSVGLRKTLVDGRSVLFDLLFPVDVVHPVAVDLWSSEFEAIAAETSLVAVFTRDESARAENGTAGVADLVELLAAAGRARRSERMLRALQGRGEERVAFLLLELALRTDRRAVRDGRSCHLRLSQRAMGEMLGLSAVHVCRVMTRLAERGLVRVERGCVEIRDITALADVAQVDPAALARAILV